MARNICPLCDEEMLFNHECLSHDFICFSLALDMLGIPFDLEPYDIGPEPKQFTRRHVSEPYVISNEAEPKVRSHVSEQVVLPTVQVNSFMDSDIAGKPVPLFLRL